MSAVTLRAAVEYFLADLDRWQLLATWDVGEDEPLTKILDETAEKGWPTDASVCSCNDVEPWVWCEPEALSEALEDLGRGAEPDTLILECLLDSLTGLQDEKLNVRVLWWREPVEEETP